MRYQLFANADFASRANQSCMADHLKASQGVLLRRQYPRWGKDKLVIRVLPGRRLFVGNEKARSRAAPVEKIYNTVRPHQSLGCLSPRQFLQQRSPHRQGVKSVNILLDEYSPFT